MRTLPPERPPGNRKNRRSFALWAILFWIALWQAASMLIGKEMLLASPVSVVLKLWQLMFTGGFCSSIFFTFLRIMSGFFIALALAVGFAALAARFRLVRELLAPLMAVLKSTPVASITILILIWISSRNLSLFMGIIMVLPVMYLNILTGIENTDRKLLEMADVFEIPPLRRLRYLYIPQVLPYFSSACKISLGLCWKAGVAAEVIGTPTGSIGEKLYQAKIYLETPELFAWTLTIIAVSALFERGMMFVIRRVTRRLEE